MIYSISFYLTTSYKLVHSDSVISMLIIVNIFDRGSGANAVGFCKHKKIILRKNVLLYKVKVATSLVREVQKLLILFCTLGASSAEASFS